MENQYNTNKHSLNDTFEFSIKARVEILLNVSEIFTRVVHKLDHKVNYNIFKGIKII